MLGRDSQGRRALGCLQDDDVVRGLRQQRREAVAKHRMIVYHEQLHRAQLSINLRTAASPRPGPLGLRRKA